MQTILLAEDEEGVRELAQEILEESGYRVLAAGSGVEAVRLAESHAGPIHLLLTDVVMPGMSGPALAEVLEFERPELKVLFVSGYADPASTARRLPRGSAFLQKPFSAAALESSVRDALGGRARGG